MPAPGRASGEAIARVPNLHRAMKNQLRCRSSASPYDEGNAFVM